MNKEELEKLLLRISDIGWEFGASWVENRPISWEDHRRINSDLLKERRQIIEQIKTLIPEQN